MLGALEALLKVLDCRYLIAGVCSKAFALCNTVSERILGYAYMSGLA